MCPARPLIVARPSAVEIMFRHTNGRSSGSGPGRSEVTSTGLSPSARSGYRRVKVSMAAYGACPGSIRFARWNVSSSSSAWRSPPIGSRIIPSWSPPADRLEDHRVVVARVDALDDPPDEPVREALDDRHALRALVPVAALELVDLVAGLRAEQLGDVLAVGGNEVHAEVLGALRDPVRAVLVREAREEARRLDADLRREPDEAAGALPVAGDRGHDEHRVVELAHERVERLHDVVGGGHRAESYPIGAPALPVARIVRRPRKTSSGS